MPQVIIPDVIELSGTFEFAHGALDAVREFVQEAGDKRNIKLVGKEGITAHGVGHFDGTRLVVEEWSGEAKAAIAVGRFARRFRHDDEAAGLYEVVWKDEGE